MVPIHKLGLVLVILFVQLISVNAQTGTADKITLKTGEVFVGNIQVKNAELVLIQSFDGSRFQFPNSEIKSIEKVDLNKLNTKADSLDEDSYYEDKVIFGLAELSPNISSAKNKLSVAPGGQLSLTFGTKLFKQKSIFTGVGIGLTSVMNTKEDETISFLPIFLALKTNLTDNINTPYILFRAGYSLALTDEMKGGLYSRLSAGWSHKLHENTTLLVGVHTEVQNFSGNLIETNENGSYSFYGDSGLLSFGLNIGLEF